MKYESLDIKYENFLTQKEYNAKKRRKRIAGLMTVVILTGTYLMQDYKIEDGIDYLIDQVKQYQEFPVYHQ